MRLPAGTEPQAITSGPDGALWFTTHQRIGRFVPGEAMTFLRVPGAKYLSAIARGSENALWFIDRQEAAIRRITTAGVITRFPLRSAPGVSLSRPRPIIRLNGGCRACEDRCHGQS